MHDGAAPTSTAQGAPRSPGTRETAQMRVGHLSEDKYVEMRTAMAHGAGKGQAGAAGGQRGGQTGLAAGCAGLQGGGWVCLIPRPWGQ